MRPIKGSRATDGKNRRLGAYVETSAGSERVRGFVPAPLPPTPPLEPGRFMHVYERAMTAVGRLDGVTTILPSTPLFLYMYVRKEALLSSQIEGTQSSLSDLLLFENHEAPAVELDDVTEVSNYVAAIEHGVSRMRGGFPLSLRLIREMHAILHKSGRGAAKQPGEFRRSQNWIGGTRPGNALFVPPPSDRLDECLHALERFLHSEDAALPPLIRAGLGPWIARLGPWIARQDVHCCQQQCGLTHTFGVRRRRNEVFRRQWLSRSFQKYAASVGRMLTSMPAISSQAR